MAPDTSYPFMRPDLSIGSAMAGVLAVGLVLGGCVAPHKPIAVTEYVPGLSQPTASQPRGAVAAEFAELTERLATIRLLRDLADQYGLAEHESTVGLIDYAITGEQRTSLHRKSREKPRSAPSATLVAGNSSGAGIGAVANTEFGRHVERCRALTGRAPTSESKAFEWLCHAAILPAAEINGSDESEELRLLGIAVTELVRIAGSCDETPGAGCRDAQRLMRRLIVLQPVSPVPPAMKKEIVDQAAMPAPARKPAHPTPF